MNPRERLSEARLYLCSGMLDGGRDLERFLDAMLGAGVDVVQLREKEASARDLLSAAKRFRTACDRHGALFIVNDRVDLALAVGADGVHLGQDDLPPEAARALAGADLIVGRSTHSGDEIRAAAAEPVDYIAVGPVFSTPTKPGRPAVGLDLLRVAAREARQPWFAIGGIDASTIGPVMHAGAERVAVVRAITAAPDPAEAARALHRALAASPSPE